MTSIVMCGHGQLAIAMKESIIMIYGEIDNVIALEFNKQENREMLIEKMADAIDPNVDTLIIVDLFGGSPYNAAAELAFKQQNIQLISGMSLPMCLEVIDKRSELPLDELTHYLVQQAPHFVKQFNKNVIQTEQENELL